MINKIRCELRLDPAVHERMKALAMESDLSLNQLVEGILAWAGANAFVGLPSPRDTESFIDSIPTPNVIWFGNDGAERDEFGQVEGIEGQGQISFMLDFRAARAAVNGWEMNRVS